MCGIIAYIGPKKIDEVLLEALARLEYRGYDSSGVASLDQGCLRVIKEAGKIKSLKQLMAHEALTGHVGIGHTRWATHGEPSKRNSHPHMDCTKSLAVVHNGIIENHEVLRKRLAAQGHPFTSDTDTEVLAHLLEEYHLKQGLSLEDAVRRVLEEIEGSYAFCVISTKNEKEFVAARNGSPLVVGLGEGENFIASDAPAILNHTRKVIFLEDYQMVVVTRDQVKVTSRQGQVVSPQITEIDWSEDAASKEGFDHFMLKEIEEQPQMIERILKNRLGSSIDDLEKKLFDKLTFKASEFASIQRIWIQACGTSWHAALTGKFFFEMLAQLPTEVDVSSEFRYRHLVPQPNTLVLSISQSGETIDSLMGLRHGKETGCKTLSLCNVLGSTIARESDAVIYTHAGPEIGVASTKAYAAQLTALFLLGLYWAKKRKIKDAAIQEILSELKQIPEKMKWIIDRKNHIRTIAEKYCHARDFLFLARGINYPNAHEGALKIKEIAYIHATGHPAGEMKHGPIALIDDKIPVVGIAPQSEVYEKMVSNLQEVKARSGKVIAIVTEGDNELSQLADDVVEIPKTHEILSPLLVALPLQYLAYYVAVLKGTDVDQPRNLAKSVTVE